jgi:hypothetical protein
MHLNAGPWLLEVLVEEVELHIDSTSRAEGAFCMADGRSLRFDDPK